jgi:hypothetical protein
VNQTININVQTIYGEPALTANRTGEIRGGGDCPMHSLYRPNLWRKFIKQISLKDNITFYWKAPLFCFIRGHKRCHANHYYDFVRIGQMHAMNALLRSVDNVWISMYFQIPLSNAFTACFGLCQQKNDTLGNFPIIRAIATLFGKTSVLGLWYFLPNYSFAGASPSVSVHATHEKNNWSLRRAPHRIGLHSYWLYVKKTAPVGVEMSQRLVGQDPCTIIDHGSVTTSKSMISEHFPKYFLKFLVR